MDIVYTVGGEDFDGPLFAERSTAEYVAQIREALYQSDTWGHFRTKLPAGEWDRLVSKSWVEPDELADDDRFTPDNIPGHADGDYPEWLRQSQLEWFPKELIEKHDGEVTLTTFSGWVLDLPAESTDAIVDDLRALGHTVEETDLDIR